MKRILLILLLLLPSTGMAENVVEYYNQLRAFEKFGLTYPVTLKNGEWVTMNMAWETDTPAVVDLSAGYIRMVDGGTGGGNFDTEVVLWRKADGTPLIGIAEVGYDSRYPDLERLRFFEGHGGEWFVSTGWVVPSIGISDFMDDDMTIGDLNTLRDIHTTVTVVLPREGTTIRAYLVLKDRDAKAVCLGEDWLQVHDKEPYFRYCNRLQGRVATRVDLMWDKEAVQFSFGARSIEKDLPWN